jgi:hypothetical protein
MVACAQWLASQTNYATHAFVAMELSSTVWCYEQKDSGHAEGVVFCWRAGFAVDLNNVECRHYVGVDGFHDHHSRDVVCYVDDIVVW